MRAIAVLLGVAAGGTIREVSADCGHGECVTMRESTEVYFRDDFRVDTGLGIRRVGGATLASFPMRVGFAVAGFYAALELEPSGIPAGAPLLPVARSGDAPRRAGSQAASAGDGVRADTAWAGYAIAGIEHMTGDVSFAIESAAGLRAFSYSGSDPDVSSAVTADVEVRGLIALRTHDIYSVGVVVAKSVVVPADWAAGVQLGVRIRGGM